MSTVKISQLPLISQINANTSNTLFAGVDIPTGATGKITAHTLAQGLYSNEVLNVGVNQQNLPNTIAQFALAGESYIQTNLVNTNDDGTADIVVTANVGSGGSDSTNFIDMGWANKNYQAGLEFNNIGNAVQPNDGYLYVQGTNGQTTGNLVLGTTSTGTQLKFTVGGGQASNIVARFTSTALVLNTQSHLTFSDGSNQYVAAAPANYTQSAFDAANTNATAISVIQGVNLTQNTNTTAVNQYAAAAYTQANTNASAILGANAYSLQVNQYAAAAFAQANVTVGVDATQNTNITAVNQFAQSAYNVANNALANTTGTFAGDLTTTGNVTTNFVRSRNTTINDNTPLAQFSGNLNTLNPSNSGYIIHAIGREGITSRIALDTSGAGTVPNYLTRHVRGTVAAPTPSQSGDIIGRFSSFGYGNTTFNTASDARIDMGATENFTDTAHGTSIQLWTTPVGANTIRLSTSVSSGNTSLYSSNTYVSGNLTVAGTTTTGNIIPATANTYSLGTPTSRWGDVWIGPNTINITDSYTGNNAALTVANGVLQIGGANQLQVGQLKFIDNTIQSTSPNVNIQVGYTTDAANVTINRNMTVTGKLSVSNTIYAANGFVNKTTSYPAAQTAISINMSTDTWVKCNVGASLAITPTTFMPGAEVIVIVTNPNTGPSGTRTITHGCSALNSSVGATNFTLGATTTAFIKYYCFNGDLANTYVQVNYS